MSTDCGDRVRLTPVYQDTDWFVCSLPAGHDGLHAGQGQTWQQDAVTERPDGRTVTDLETTALEGLASGAKWGYEGAVAAVRELARQAAGAQTLRDALEQIADSATVIGTPGVLDRSFSGQTAQEYKRLARAALATPDTPPTCSTCGATDPAANVFCSNGFHAPDTPPDAPTEEGT